MSQPIWFAEMLRQLTPEQLEEWEERSAIIQYDAGFDRGHAECLALILLIRKYSLTFDKTLFSVSYENKEKTHG